MNPQATRHEDLKGNKELIYYCRPRDPSFTHYNGFFMGKPVPESEKAEIIDTFTTSAMQMPSPDPTLMRKSMQRQSRFNEDTKNVDRLMPNTAHMSQSPFKTGGKAQALRPKYFDGTLYGSSHY